MSKYIIARRDGVKKNLNLSILVIRRSARVAQLVERQAFNLNVQGSSPCSGEIFLAIFGGRFVDPITMASEFF